ncbi:MAG TPA: M14 family zinc carboxypeptidase [Candidatus Saccharimonadales bacterium]|nr:M14 family zinc carboxypeptidase [Candidatus Saccharimonadales bacterium]
MHALRRPAARVLLLGALLLAPLLLVGPAVRPTAAAEPSFPTGNGGFHTYTEMASVVAKAATDHPSIVRRFSIGESYQGRAMWAVKISDHVATDEAEPEVVFDGLHHGDEHMSLEMTLAILRWLTDGYGSDSRVTKIVDSREIWIVFAVNPDGATYDIAGTGGYRNWRKNRQPTADSSSIGTDLNRNYDYRWGCCGGASSTPSSTRFKGRAAFSSPEASAFADFVRSRVVRGRQQIRASISFHTTGRLVMWPYGYTLTNIPSDMTADDHAALVALGKRMAASNGYKPMQASDLYYTSGTSRDWLYGTYRIFAYTFEMSPDSTPYPSDEQISPETGRNKEAVLDLLEVASCLYSVIGKSTVRCGAVDDDLEVARGWVVNPDGTDTATSGAFGRADPGATKTSLGPKQLGTTPSGIRAYVTGAAAGSSSTANDLDGGTTTTRSPRATLPNGTGQKLAFRWTFAHGPTATSADWLRVEIIDEADIATTVFQVSGAPKDRDGSWQSASISMDAWAGETIRIRLAARDGSNGNLVEAGIDDVRITRP